MLFAMNKAFTFDGHGEEDDVPASQSPWEFSQYSDAVAHEHLTCRTTSIDHKISQARLAQHDHDSPHDDDDDDEELEERYFESRKTRRRPPSDGKLQNIADADSETDNDHGSEDTAPRSDSASDEESEGNVAKEELQMVDEEGEEQDETEDELADSASEGEQKNLRSAKQSVVKSNKKAMTPSKEAMKAPAKFFSSVEGATFNAKTFMQLNISRPLLRACDTLGYKQPTPIQAACIPLALTGRDICGSAVTGSGKTAAFALPLLERLLFRPRRIPAIRVLILTPTRELAVQVHSMIEKLAQYTDIHCCLVVGGLSSKVQEVALRSHPDIVVATPGRMIDHLHNTHSVGLEDLAILVLDEADRLLELGFSNEVQELVRLCPKRRQTMLFSATMTEEVNELIKLSLVNPVRLSADPSTQRPATLLEQVIKIRPQHEADREAVLLSLCTRSFASKAIIFSGTKMEAHRLKILFGLSGLKAAELHGNLTQAQRLDALELFRKKEVDFLIATDVAARGLDIVGVETVINFECPRNITTYVHRVGRTARAGQQGCAVTFVSERDRPLLKAVAKRAGSKLTSRVLPVSAIMKWHDKIAGQEEAVRAIIQEEREERALRKAEMEANKAQNLMDHESEIFSRPKKTWFQTPKEKRQIASAAKAAKEGTRNNGDGKKLVSIEEAEKARKAKRPLEQEKNMTRKKRRRLEAAREAAAEDNHEVEKSSGQRFERAKDKTSDKWSGNTLADLGYRRAKAAKAYEKAKESGKVRNRKSSDDKRKSKPPREKGRREEMQELFQGDRIKSKMKNQKSGKVGATKAKRNPSVSKKSFKSKARYKRR